MKPQSSGSRTSAKLNKSVSQFHDDVSEFSSRSFGSSFKHPLHILSQASAGVIAKSTKELVGIFVTGFSSNSSVKRKDESLLMEQTDMIRIGVPVMQIHHMHDPDVNKMLSFRYLTKLLPRPRRNNKFVREVFDLVMNLLHTGKQVALVGHSYGGCVVSVVAELLNELPQPANDVHIIALGGICIAPMRKTENVNIIYMYNNNDPALFVVRSRGWSTLEQKNVILLGNSTHPHSYQPQLFFVLAILNTHFSLSYVFREAMNGGDIMEWTNPILAAYIA